MRANVSAVLRFPIRHWGAKKLVTDAYGCRRKRAAMRIRVRTRIKRRATSRRNRRAGIACATRARDRPRAVRSMRSPRHPCNEGVARKHESECRYVRRLRAWLRSRTQRHRRCTRCARDWSTVECGGSSSNAMDVRKGEERFGAVSMQQQRRKPEEDCRRVCSLIQVRAHV